MKKHLKRAVIDMLGVGFLVLGVLGIFLPFLQGFLFIAIGVYLLSLHSRWAQTHLERFKSRHHKFAELFDWLDIRVRKFFGLEITRF